VSVLEQINALTPQGVKYPAALLEKFNDHDAFDREQKGYLVNGGEGGAYNHWLTLLAQHADARLILELGNRYGVSTLALYHGLPRETRLITVDTVKDQRYVPANIFNDPRVRFIFGDALDLSAYDRAGVDIPIDIDILWTDTVHFYDQVKSEFFVYEPLLADDCIIVIDDCYLNDKGKFFREAPYEKFDLAKLCHVNGFGVILYKRPEAERKQPATDRVRSAMMRSMETGYRRYWDVKSEYDRLEQDVRYLGFIGALRKLKRASRGLLSRT